MNADDRSQTTDALRREGCTYIGRTSDGVHYWEHEAARSFHACSRVPRVWADTCSHLATAAELRGTRVTAIVALPVVVEGYRRRGLLPSATSSENVESPL